MHSEGIQDGKKLVISLLDNQGACRKNDFNESRLSHFPIHRKALNSLTWDAWFSFTHSTVIFWCSDAPGLLQKLLSILYILPYLFRALPESYLRGCLLGLSPQKIYSIKSNSTFRLWFFFFFQLTPCCHRAVDLRFEPKSPRIQILNQRHSLSVTFPKNAF